MCKSTLITTGLEIPEAEKVNYTLHRCGLTYFITAASRPVTECDEVSRTRPRAPPRVDASRASGGAASRSAVTQPWCRYVTGWVDRDTSVASP